MSPKLELERESCTVVAIVICYFPDRAKLVSLLRALRPQVAHIVIVDNGPSDWVESCLQEYPPNSIRLISQGDNRGVAQAINTGVEAARKLSATHVILFDQDSVPDAGMVARLFEVMQERESQGAKVAAVGPRYVDGRTDNPPPFFQLQGVRLVRASCKGDAVIPADYLISSGCLIPMSALDDVGLMDTRLFIDYVDIEWGLRARGKGYQSFGVCDAYMQHALGDEPLVLLGQKVPLHSPLRHYYLMRNRIWLYRQAWIPAAWKLADGYRLLLKYVGFSLLAKPRFKHFSMMTLGMWHGLIGNMGRYCDRDTL